LADPSDTIDALTAHVELITDLLAVVDGHDPPASNPDGHSDGSPAPCTMSKAAPVAPLLERLGSDNCTLDHLIHVLAVQLVFSRPGD
jgi:hypothetical protein